MYHMPNPHITAQMRLTAHELNRLQGSKTQHALVLELRSDIKKHYQRIKDGVRLSQRVCRGGTVSYLSIIGEDNQRKSKSYKTRKAAEEESILYNKRQIRYLREEIKRIQEGG